MVRVLIRSGLIRFRSFRLLEDLPSLLDVRLYLRNTVMKLVLASSLHATSTQRLTTHEIADMITETLNLRQQSTQHDSLILDPCLAVLARSDLGC